MAEVHEAPADNQSFIDLPLVASVFGKKKLNVSPFNAAIQSDVEILRMLGPSRRDDIHLGLAKRLERFISNISERVDAGESYESYSPVLEMICRAYNPGWLMIARWHLETGSPSDFEKAKRELKLHLEDDPTSADSAEAWRMLGHACYRTGDTLSEIHAFIERAQIGSVPFYDISNTANRLNRLLRERGLELDKDEKRVLAQRLVSILEKRRNEASADDLSRMAWLALHIGQEAKAREYAEAGLAMEPENYHCRKIAERLGMNI